MAKSGSSAMIVAPKVQNHEIASTGSSRSRRRTMCITTAKESAKSRGFGRSVPAAGGAGGIRRAVTVPITAHTTPMTPTMAGPPVIRTTLPPMIVPSRIDRKVPASIRALPATSSSSRRCWGSSAYLIGPNTVEWVPSANTAASSSGTLASHRPRPPSAMMPISTILTQRAIAALSTRSASVPDTPENRKNGAMNSACASSTSVAAAMRPPPTSTPASAPVPVTRTKMT